jgi:hypothetical protein
MSKRLTLLRSSVMIGKEQEVNKIGPIIDASPARSTGNFT